MAKKAGKSTFFADFKKFISKGNIIDMATGVIIATSFGKIVTSLVNDIIMPPIGLLLGSVNFTDLKWVLNDAVLDDAGAVVTEAVSINYGNFIQVIIDFLLVALCIFLILRAIVKAQSLAESMKKKEEEEAAETAQAPEPAPIPEPSEEVLLLREIRDSLKKQG